MPGLIDTTIRNLNGKFQVTFIFKQRPTGYAIAVESDGKRTAR